MVEKELAEKDEHVLKAIQYLGDQGILDEPAPQLEPTTEGIQEVTKGSGTESGGDGDGYAAMGSAPADTEAVPGTGDQSMEDHSVP